MRYIIIATDSFKHSLSSASVAKYLKQGMLDKNPSLTIEIIPVADGGEGTVEALVDATEGQTINHVVHDPLGRKTKASFGISGDKKTGFIELAKGSGLELLEKNEQNPLKTSTFGTGELIKAVIDKGCKSIILGIGGSATIDGGAGAMAALGAIFFDKTGKVIYPTGGNLAKIDSFDLSGLDNRLKETQIFIASDVNNPLTGKNGAAQVYGPQKGAGQNDIYILDKNLYHLAQIITRQKPDTITSIPGVGAAGGFPACLLAFTNAQINNGFALIAEFLKLEEKFRNAEMIITGEGKIDAQTQYGKAPYGVARIARKLNKKVIAVAGSVEKEASELVPEIFDKIIPLVEPPFDLQKALKQTPELLTRAGKEIAKQIEH
jgi:glycerate kinase